MKTRLLLGMAALLALGVPAVKAQTTHDNVPTNFVNVNVGSPLWATFYFGHPVNGTPGTIALVIQCQFQRAELITDYGVASQAVSHFFAVTCSSVPGTEGGFPTLTVTLDGTPLSESLVMVRGDGSTFNLNLTTNNATWTVFNPGHRGESASGNSQIVVGAGFARAVPLCGSKQVRCPGFGR